MSLFDVSILTTYAAYKTYVNGSGEYSFGNAVLAGNTLVSTIQPATTTTTTDAQGVSTTVEGGNVSMVKSDGTNALVFNSVADGLACLHHMHINGLYYLQLSDDIVLINLSGVKLLILETTFLNQKLMNAYCFSYNRGRVRATHRNLSTVKSLTDALKSVGFQLVGSDFNNNYSLQAALSGIQRPYIQVFDLKYKSNPTALNVGSFLEDSTQLLYIESLI
jgi:hypothetical protein